MRLKKTTLNSTLVALSTLLSVTAIDLALGYLGTKGITLEQVSHAPNLVEKRDNIEFNYEFKTNAQGFRHPAITEKKAQNSFRVLVVGDSFVEGFGVAIEETFTAQLGDKYQSSSIEFINAGLSGQGPLKYKALIQAFTSRLEIDGILLGLYANDLADMGTPPGYSWYQRTLLTVWPNIANLMKTIKHKISQPSHDTSDEHIQFVNQVVSIASSKGIADESIDLWKNALEADWIEAANRKHISAPVLSFGLLHPNFWSESIDVDTPGAQQKWQSMKETLADIEEFTTDTNTDLAVVYIPSVFQYDANSFNIERPWPALGSALDRNWLSGNTEIQKLLNEFATEKNIRYLDLTPQLRSFAADGKESLNYRLDEHFTPEGHRVAAELIGSWIDEEKVYPFIQ
jgi:hypothetical protein